MARASVHPASPRRGFTLLRALLTLSVAITLIHTASVCSNWKLTCWRPTWRASYVNGRLWYTSQPGQDEVFALMDQEFLPYNGPTPIIGGKALDSGLTLSRYTRWSAYTGFVAGHLPSMRGPVVCVPTISLVVAAWLALGATVCLTRWMRTRAKGLCRACGYNLTGLPSAVPCPECGHGAAATANLPEPRSGALR